MRSHQIPDDYVAMAEKICPICGCKHTHDTGIIIHKNLRSIPEDELLTGWELCEEDAKKNADGYIALIEIDNKATNQENERIQMEDANRTGRLLHLRREIAAEMFKGFDTSLEFVFIDQKVFKLLVSIAHPEGIPDELKED